MIFMNEQQRTINFNANFLTLYIYIWKPQLYSKTSSLNFLEPMGKWVCTWVDNQHVLVFNLKNHPTLVCC
jgi:hypothetical protein